MLRPLILVSLLLLCIQFAHSQEKGISFVAVDSFHIPKTSIRAIQVVDDSTLWFAGSGGKFGRITNGILKMDSIQYENRSPHFRALASNGKDVFLLSIENPALLYRIQSTSGPGSPELVYRESHPKVFYDSMVFFDEKNGIAMGDPTSDCLSVISTNDGGLQSTKLDCGQLLRVHPGEAAFAASNSNIAVSGENAWMVTGGGSARVFRSTDYGATWEVHETPLQQGGQMTGIFTVDFYDRQHGIIMGGNWENKADTERCAAYTKDGGQTWTLVEKEAAPGYISCVRYVPGHEGRKLVAVSTRGSFASTDGGVTWRKLSNQGFYSIRFVDDTTAWASSEEWIYKIKFDQL